MEEEEEEGGGGGGGEEKEDEEEGEEEEIYLIDVYLKIKNGMFRPTLVIIRFFIRKICML